jgi:hypothetical protein
MGKQNDHTHRGKRKRAWPSGVWKLWLEDCRTESELTKVNSRMTQGFSSTTDRMHESVVLQILHKHHRHSSSSRKPKLLLPRTSVLASKDLGLGLGFKLVVSTTGCNKPEMFFLHTSYPNKISLARRNKPELYVTKTTHAKDLGLGLTLNVSGRFIVNTCAKNTKLSKRKCRVQNWMHGWEIKRAEEASDIEGKEWGVPCWTKSPPHASALLVGNFVGYDISDIRDGWLLLLQGECGKIHPWICNNTPTSKL